MPRVAAQAAVTPSARPPCQKPHPVADDDADDVAAGRAERDANANLAEALGDVVRNDAVDADRGERERQRAEDGGHDEEQLVRAASADRLRDEVGERNDLGERQIRVRRKNLCLRRSIDLGRARRSCAAES